MAKRTRKWIQKTGIAKRGHKGALHRQLGIPEDETIPVSTLHKAAHAPGKLGLRARLALVFRGMKHHYGAIKQRRAKRRKTRHAQSR